MVRLQPGIRLIDVYKRQEPVRQLEAQEKNTYDYIFSRFPTEQGEEFFAIDTKDGSVIG